MQFIQPDIEDPCPGCVFYPPNLPAHAYSAGDFAMLRGKTCSFDFSPHDADCRITRKTSCSLLDLSEPQ